MTSRDHEFPLAEWAARAQHVVDYGPALGHGYHLDHGVELCVLGDGLRINFCDRESLPNRVIDLVFAALVTGAVTLARPDHGGHGPWLDVGLVDQILAASPALGAYLGLYADDTPGVPAAVDPPARGGVRRLLTPPAEQCPDYSRSPWAYGRRTR